MPSNAGLTNRAFSSGMSVLENDVRNVPGYIAGFKETAAEMCIPLVFFGEKLGILAVESSAVGAFQPEDLPTLESVADMCAAAIQNARYIERAKELAYLDGLTGIFNRRFFEMRITEELERANRYTTQLSVIMLDIDHFKRLNDEFGHLLGDEVLRQVSTIFRQQVRKGDVVCRFGGEEFALLLPQTSGEQAQEAAEKLRRLVENWNFPGVPRPVTISAGIACYPENGRTRDQIVSSADAALYSAKQTGRNRVERAMAVGTKSVE
jgi:diguanylate cyclase (GGDEF)-like protein